MKKGFSIIEVTLVFAIGAMIFLMVFTVLPTMWMNERDEERREDVAIFINNLKNFQTNNNRGALPREILDLETINISGKLGDGPMEIKLGNDYSSEPWKDFYSKYFKADFSDPLSDGSLYDLKIMKCTANLANKCDNTESGNNILATIEDGKLGASSLGYTMFIFTGATCDGDTPVKSANARKVAVVYKMERVGQYCSNT